MRLVMLASCAAFHPSPRGRWLPLAHQLSQAGVQVAWLGLHPHFTAPMRTPSEVGGVHMQHVAQMHVDAAGPLHGWRLYLQLLLASWQLVRYGMAWHPDVVCVCKAQPSNGLAGLLICALTGARLVVDSDDDEAASHQFAHAWQHHLMAWWERLITRQAHSVTTASSVLAHRAQQWGARYVAHVPTGIDVRPTDTQLPYPLPPQYLVYVGNLATQAHGLDVLLHALAVDNTLPPLVIAGDGHQAQALHQLARQLGVDARCHWLGHIPAQHVPALLRGAVASVDPVHENAGAAARFPLKILESLAVGTPVITSPLGDRTWLVGTAGMLVPAGDAEALARACATMVTRTYDRRTVQHQMDALHWSHIASQWGHAHQLL